MNKKVKILRIFVALSFYLTSTIGYSIDLNTKIQNADKSDFNSISSPFLNNKKFTFSTEFLNSVNPLVLKRSDGTTVPLIQGLNVFELSFLFGLTESIQLGILIPGENPFGIVGPYNEAKHYLNNILIEPKIYISEGIALIPLYYIPNSNNVSTEINGSKADVNLSKKNGAYGAKFVFGFGDKSKNETLTAIQIGAIMAPEDKFREIDQSLRLQLGFGVAYPLTGTLKLLLEAYGEKTKNNTPLEALATIEYKNENFMMRLGGGNGDLQGSGSNTSKVLANFTYYFGDEKKEKTKTINYETKEPATPIEKEKKPEFQNDPIEEQVEPSFSKNEFILENDLIIAKKTVPLEKREVPLPKTPQKEKQEVICVLSDRKKDRYRTLKKERVPASEPISPEMERHQANIKKAIQLLENNVFLFQKSLIEKNIEKSEELRKEINWGLRVYNKNLKAIKELSTSDNIVLEYNFQVDIVEKILSGEITKIPDEVFIVSVAKLNVRSKDFISRDNIIYQLNQGDEVVIIGETANNGFVQIKPITGEFVNYKFPLFVGKKFLTKKKVLIGEESKKEEKAESKENTLHDQLAELPKKESEDVKENRSPSVNNEILELPKKNQSKDKTYLFPIKLDLIKENPILEEQNIKETKIENNEKNENLEKNPVVEQKAKETQDVKNKIEIVEEVVKKETLEQEIKTVEKVNPILIEPKEEPVVSKDTLPKEDQLIVDQKKQEVEKKEIADKVKEESLKQQELKKVDELFLELKSKAKNDIKDVKVEKVIETKNAVKEEKTDSTENKFKELIKKSSDGLEESAPIEEQNGPSFGDI